MIQFGKKQTLLASRLTLAAQGTEKVFTDSPPINTDNHTNIGIAMIIVIGIVLIWEVVNFMLFFMISGCMSISLFSLKVLFFNLASFNSFWKAFDVF